MNTFVRFSVLAMALAAGTCVSAQNPAADTRVELTLDASEAEQSLLMKNQQRTRR
jgi:hypothetical protein